MREARQLFDAACALGKFDARVDLRAWGTVVEPTGIGSCDVLGLRCTPDERVIPGNGPAVELPASLVAGTIAEPPFAPLWVSGPVCIESSERGMFAARSCVASAVALPFNLRRPRAGSSSGVERSPRVFDVSFLRLFVPRGAIVGLAANSNSLK